MRALALALLLLPAVAAAHPLSFGVLELRDERDGRVRVTWRFSGAEGRATGAEPVLPARCREVSPAEAEPIADGVARAVTVDCGRDGIAGARVSVRGLEHSGVQVVVRHVSARGAAEAVLDDAHRAWTVPARSDRAGVLSRYLTLGVEHIATGWDHLAFVLGLALVVRGRRALLAAITAFTAGHSATLALASLGLAHAPPRAVEAAIAWSIVVVAREALVRDRGPALRAPWAVAALFGLLHGFGFAGALGEVGLPRDAILAALVAFNAGVELGQLAFVALGLALAAVAMRLRVPERPARVALSYAVGVAGACWCAVRVSAMFE